MNFLRILILLACMHSLNAKSELPSSQAINSDQVITDFKEKKKYIPEDQVISDFEVNDPEVNKMLREAKKAFEDLAKPKKEMIPEERVKVELPQLPEIKVDIVKKTQSSVKKRKIRKKKRKTTHVDLNNGVRIFKRHNKVKKRVKGVEVVSLPSGSTALATVMYGAEVAKEKRPVMVRLDWAFLGPNKAVVELKGCVMWMNVSGNYNTERIYGTANQVSCRAPNGKTFEVKVLAHMIDKKDEYLGVKSKLLTRGKIAAAAMSFLAGGTKAFGEAMAAAQTTNNVSSTGAQIPPVETNNITGNQEKYIIGKTAGQAAGRFLDWFVDYYTSLSPTLAMPPGTKVFLTTQGEIKIPKVFFKEKLEKGEVARKMNTEISIWQTQSK